MERIYALGVTCIEFIQYWFEDSEDYFEAVNDITNPNNALDMLFPLVSIVDSVFAAQLLLCMAFGGWLNAVMKWWLLEDRPYWWVRETDFYDNNSRPVLRQYRQTCETGPGCPSGHSKTTAMLLMLIICWISHVQHDRKLDLWWWKYIVYPACSFAMVSVMLARLFIGTHFPHQVLLGTLLGAFLAPALCIYVSDPFIWRVGYHSTANLTNTVLWHVASVLVTILIALLTYYGLLLCGWEPLWTVKLAFRWCQQPEHIHVTTTPMYSLAHSTGHLLGWALAVTPHIARYRHYTKNRSLIISAFVTASFVYTWRLMQQNISKDSAYRFYALHFLISAIKPILVLRVAPAAAMWPFEPVKDKVA